VSFGSSFSAFGLVVFLSSIDTWLPVAIIQTQSKDGVGSGIMV
jgi:hypothetical protein